MSSECMQDNMVSGFEMIHSVLILTLLFREIKKKKKRIHRLADYSYFMRDSGMAHTLNF